MSGCLWGSRQHCPLTVGAWLGSGLVGAADPVLVVLEWEREWEREWELISCGPPLAALSGQGRFGAGVEVRCWIG